MRGGLQGDFAERRRGRRVGVDVAYVLGRERGVVGEAYLAHAGEGEVLHERDVEMRGAAEAVEPDVDV